MPTCSAVLCGDPVAASRTVLRVPMQEARWHQLAQRHLTPAPASAHTRRRVRPAWLGLLARAPGLAPVWQLAGAHLIGEPGDLPWATAQEAQAMAREAVAAGCPLQFGRVPAASPLIPALRQAATGRAWLRVTPVKGWPWIDLGPRWQDPASCYGPRRRSDLRRFERRAAELGTLTFEWHAPGAQDDWAGLLHEVMAVEARSWKGQAGSALQCDAAMGRFFRDLAQSAAQAGELRIALARIDGQAVAAQLAIVWEQRYWLFKVGYDPAFARCSPGNLLMLFAVAQAATQGLRSFELLGNPSPWTDQWSTTLRECVQVQLFPANLAGLGVLAGHAWSAWRRRWTRTATPVAQPALQEAQA